MNFSAPEQKINLATLQHKDPFITNIRANAKHVNLYTYKAEANEWVSSLWLWVWLTLTPGVSV